MWSRPEWEGWALRGCSLIHSVHSCGAGPGRRAAPCPSAVRRAPHLRAGRPHTRFPLWEPPPKTEPALLWTRKPGPGSGAVDHKWRKKSVAVKEQSKATWTVGRSHCSACTLKTFWWQPTHLDTRSLNVIYKILKKEIYNWVLVAHIEVKS